MDGEDPPEEVTLSGCLLDSGDGQDWTAWAVGRDQVGGPINRTNLLTHSP